MEIYPIAENVAYRVGTDASGVLMPSVDDLAKWLNTLPPEQLKEFETRLRKINGGKDLAVSSPNEPNQIRGNFNNASQS